MDSIAPGALVTVTDGSTRLDGIVFETPSSAKVVVAVVDPTRGPRMRTVHPNTLSERSEESANDRALWLLIKRTTPATNDATRAATSGKQRRSGFARGTAHRPTGR